MPGPAPTSAASLHPSPSLSRRTRRSVGPDRRGDGDGRAQGGAGGAPGSTRGGGVQICCKGAPRRDRRRGPRRPRPASSPSRCAFCTRDVRFALENGGWNCTFECEVHLSAPEAPAVVAVRPAAALPWARGGAPSRSPPSRPVRGPPVGPRRRRLSESVAKAPIAPERRKRNVDIPRFFSPSILARSAFAADLDTPPPRVDPGSPHAPLRARPCHHDDPRLRARRAFSAARRRSGSGR